MSTIKKMITILVIFQVLFQLALAQTCAITSCLHSGVLNTTTCTCTCFGSAWTDKF